MRTDDALIKIRNQIKIADGYRIENPYWNGVNDVLDTLRKRERAIANEIQVQILQSALKEMNI